MTKTLLDLIDSSTRQASATLRELETSPAVKHLRRAGVELLRAARCGIDGAIDRLEPPRHAKESEAEAEQ